MHLAGSCCSTCSHPEHIKVCEKKQCSLREAYARSIRALLSCQIPPDHGREQHNEENSARTIERECTASLLQSVGWERAIRARHPRPSTFVLLREVRSVLLIRTRRCSGTSTVINTQCGHLSSLTIAYARLCSGRFAMGDRCAGHFVMICCRSSSPRVSVRPRQLSASLRGV